MDDIKQFIRFLKDNNAYHAFNQNLWYEKYKDVMHYLNDVENRNSYLVDAFDWSKTEQGHDFWDNLDEKWYDYE